MPTAIKIENVSKQYRLGVISTGTLSHDLNRWWTTNVLRREDPYLKIGETNDRASKGNSEYVWALKDINMEIEQGDVVGIIGKNGAGKSTLLKLLSRVTKPTTGTIKYRGRIASLLEVGTGFHPEMTGRENIYMNGAIMGMTRAEITRKLDEIVDFSGCERYIDTPVKRYSSGMTVRLGFAIAAHLDPEILVVDEVLAVGDAEFQKKAIGKMQDVSKGEGRTVLFVSHNMASIRDLCHNGILLSNGLIKTQGAINNVIDDYLYLSKAIASKIVFDEEHAPGSKNIKIRAVYFINEEGNEISVAYINQKFGLHVEYEVLQETGNFTCGINAFNSEGIHLFTSHSDSEYKKGTVSKGFYQTTAWIPDNILQPDNITFSFACMRYEPFEVLFHEMDLVKIEVLDVINTLTRNNHYKADLPGLVRPYIKWDNSQK